MDIRSSKKSRLIYQQGDSKTRGVVDLRGFVGQKKCPERASRVFYEVKPARIKGPVRACEEELAEKPQADMTDNGRLETVTNLEELIEKLEDVPESLREASCEKNTENLIALFLSDLRKRLLFKSSVMRPTPFLFRRRTVIMPQMEMPGMHRRKVMVRFAVSSFMIPIIIFSFSFVQSQFDQKGRVLGESTAAYENLKSAAQYALGSDFSSMEEKFNDASFNFVQAQGSINGIGNGIGEIIGALPVNTPFSTAQNLAAAGENVSLAGKEMGAMIKKISEQSEAGENGKSSLAALAGLDENLRNIAAHLKVANENMQKVDANHIPEAMRQKVELAKRTLPAVSRNMQNLSEDYPFIMEMLGSQRSQKYLLLFENNTEMRATGGFIGSYGILDIENGRMNNLAIDGVFNPDGQLREKIVPPMPIQKVSASWSMHDSNWFADFPTSAKKAALFYEKTGGPTVDGVIAVTPDAVKKLLELTGPIEMPAYGVTITSENFVAQTQSQVEDLYDKKENNPKKILSDIAPILIDRLLGNDSLSREAKAERLLGVVQKTEESLREKDILIYHRDEDVERMIQDRGWGGEIVQNQSGDYLAVINSNINGYKTDAVIEESIDLQTEIGEDGTVVDTLTIRRKHNGGKEQYDWYNRVNADYMRVYVPKGSVLLEASGNTAEEYAPPIDYSSFRTDPDVAAVEKTIKIDQDSKTQVFEEAGKTVFGNWVYVSPQEEATIIYKYQLPFKIDFNGFKNAADAYSAIIQKQAGSADSNFTAAVKLPQRWKMAWETDNFRNSSGISEKLSKDTVYAEIFTRS